MPWDHRNRGRPCPAKEVQRVNPGSHVAVSLYDENTGSVRIRSIIGLDKNLDKIARIF
jgi:hypothetical protein